MFNTGEHVEGYSNFLLGLTDEHIARNGKRDLTGMIGHQARDHKYVIDVRRPAVVSPSGP